MSIDRSLKIASSLSRHRNVLTRAERLKKLAEEEHWKTGESVFGLPKVANRNLRVGKKSKKEEKTASETAEETAKSKESSEQ